MSQLFNIDLIRSQFPSLDLVVNDKPLIYFDSAATTQKPQCVIDSLNQYYSGGNANVHRGSHSLTGSSTRRFEAARRTVADFLCVNHDAIVWTKGATEALNLIAQSYARTNLSPGDEILVSEMEHHANIVPWQLVAEQTGAKIVKLPVDPETCTLDMDAFYQRLTERTKIVAVCHINNVTGTRNPIEEIIEASHRICAVTVIDGAQGIVHERLDLTRLGADFYTFSGHKLFAPAGIGVLYGKPQLLDAMPPWHGGGKMVEKVSFEGTQFSQSPTKFEAGTPNVAGVIALADAIHWFNNIDLIGAEQHIASLQKSLYQGLSQIPDLRVVGYQPGSSIVSFVIDGVHPSDIATLLDQQGIAARSGHHCAHPMMDALNVPGTLRVSLAIYNTQQEISQFIEAMEIACDIL
ncbi:aminotransferase class V-fold PLP-dependent enzyme [Veronia pacifica]|uniref:Probable cysteine desulfurase n=1 Tax=Veronia pacifica TaxID=1080227 RepID=A0A1C3EI53_9GAMM|nr:SufS family cysteine desulfurase [Veronia pacifica]ODA32916.1 cysteine sulfinate desulfinase [Veronia pacifica]